MNKSNFQFSSEKPLSLTRDDFAIIGRALVIRNLPIAKEIINDELKQARTEWDLSRIPAYYFPGMDKRLFVGIVLTVYNYGHNQKISPKRGLPIEVARVLNMPRSHTYVLIKEVLVHLKAYDDFREKVESYLKSITENKPDNL